jgi:hypothetical protein
VGESTETKNSTKVVDEIILSEEEIRNYLNAEFDDSITTTSLSATSEFGIITVYLHLTFESGVTSEIATIDFCNESKNKLQSVSDREFNTCIYPSGTRYVAGNVVTMMVRSTPASDSGAMGLTSSVIIIGIPTLLHILYRNIY